MINGRKYLYKGISSTDISSAEKKVRMYILRCNYVY